MHNSPNLHLYVYDYYQDLRSFKYEMSFLEDYIYFGHLEDHEKFYRFIKNFSYRNFDNNPILLSLDSIL